MGKVMMSGIVPQMKDPGILARDLAVGSSVFLMESGAPVEYLVVNQGIPGGSSLYDASCNGTWLLRKDIYENRVWHSSNVNAYADATIHGYLNADFLARLGSAEQAKIKQVRIPYVDGNGTSGSVVSGGNGLQTKVFLLGASEAGFSGDHHRDGEPLSYFAGCATTGSDAKRIAYLSGSKAFWFFRTPPNNLSTHAHGANTTGDLSYVGCNQAYGIRPVMVLHSTVVFDENTLTLKGVA